MIDINSDIFQNIFSYWSNFIVFKLGFKLVTKNEIFSLVEFHIFVPLFFLVDISITLFVNSMNSS